MREWYRSNPPGKGVLKMCRRFLGEHPCRTWNYTLAWVFSCTFAAYFQNTFSWTPLKGCFWMIQYLLDEFFISRDNPFRAHPINSFRHYRRKSQYRSSCPEVFLKKDALEICSKFAGEHPCRSAVSIKLLCTSAWVFSCKFAAYFQNTFS